MREPLPWTRPRDGMVFTEGMLVRGLGWHDGPLSDLRTTMKVGDYQRFIFKGRLIKVVAAAGSCVADLRDDDGREHAVYADWMEPATLAIVPGTLVRCRDAKFSVKSFEWTKDKLRPLTAIIGHPVLGEMSLSYGPTGHFYGEVDQAIDLIPV